MEQTSQAVCGLMAKICAPYRDTYRVVHDGRENSHNYLEQKSGLMLSRYFWKFDSDIMLLFEFWARWKGKSPEQKDNWLLSRELG